MKSYAWRKKRQQALKYWGGRCFICGTTKRLECHHVSYKRFGNESMTDLRILCRAHHREMTDFHWKIGRRTPGPVAFKKFVEYKRKKR